MKNKDRVARGGSLPHIMLSQTVNEVATRYPITLKVLLRHGLDTCCGGIHPLEMAARAHGVDPEALLQELNDAAAGGGEASDAPNKRG